MPTRSTGRVVSCGFAAVGCLVVAGLAAGAMRQEAGEEDHRPRYAADGRLEVPKGYRSWTYVGTDLSPRYRSEEDVGKADATPPEKEQPRPRGDDTFHAVYINPESYEAFLKTGQFPDPTILVMEVFRAEERDPGGVLASGQFQGKRVAIEAAVKDSKRPGGGVPWAYYDLPLDKDARPGKPAKAKPDQDCYQCHLKHASKDNVWVQFYPALRDPE
ncbi:MAG: cytochrome P460 family protein [Isosphaeraceae bacterium]